MSKFNEKASGVGKMTDTHNLAGGAAYKIKDTRKDLASVILASMLKSNSYYETDNAAIDHVFDLVGKLEDKTFAAKAMVYVRQEGNLRSVSHVLANACAENGVTNLRGALAKAIVRPDDMTEMSALWFARHEGKMLPNSMRRAFKDKLESNTWDAYQLKKYMGGKRSVKLKDLILLSHPVDKSGLLKGVLDGTIKAPKTLEAKLAGGQKASAAFEDMLIEGRLGYMAAMKNIRNALQTGLSDEALILWCEMISNPKRVAKSRMLPFRFVDAWFAIKDLSIDHFKLEKIKGAINSAITASAMNLDFVNSGEKIALILDESASMNISRMDTVGPWDHAIILAATLYTALPRENIVVYKFSDNCTKISFGTMSPLDIIENTMHNGYQTLFHAPLQLLTSTRTKVDKIIMLTDMQLYSNCIYDTVEDTFTKYYNEYKRKVSPNVKFLFWNLVGYGASTPLELKNDVLLAAGFSDKLLALIPKMWKDQNALVNEIESIEV